MKRTCNFEQETKREGGEFIGSPLMKKQTNYFPILLWK